MFQKQTNEGGSLAVKDVQPYQRVGRVNQAAPKKVLVVREKCRLFQPLQERNNVRVFNARWREFFNEKPAADTPLTELSSLVVPDVLIQQNHAAINSSG
jgi:hypothetical protein